jgi:uncharacterized protein YneF (UPF0154 family)
MSASQEIRELESELENRRRDLREDAARISGKIEEAKAKLSPTNFVRERAILVMGGALLLGLAIGYLVSRRKLPVEVVVQPAIEHLGKPTVRRMLTTAGKDAATRAVHGR